MSTIERVDLEELPGLARLGVAGQGSRAQADDADRGDGAEQLRRLASTRPAPDVGP